MGHVRNALWVLAVLCIAPVHADTYYEKTTIPPTIAAHSFPCNATGSTAAPTQCTALNSTTVGATTRATGAFTTLGANGLLTASGGVRLSGTNTLTLSGSYSVGSSTSPNFLGLNSIVTGDVSNAVSYAPIFTNLTFTNFTKSAAPYFVAAAEFDARFGGTGDVGLFGGVMGKSIQTAQTGNLAAGQLSYFVGGTFQASGAANEGGTAGAANGYGTAFGLNPYCILNASATYWRGCVGIEVNTEVVTGASVEDKVGIQIIQTSSDKVAGTLENSALVISNQASAVGWDIGIAFGQYFNVWPMTAAGTLIGCAAPLHVGSCGTTAHGVDFSNITLSSDAFKSNAFSVDGSGNLSALKLTSTVSTGTAPLVVASTTNVANLNASSLSGATFSAPGAIGGGTPSTGAFTTLSASGQITSTLATGTAPFAVSSTTAVSNLNASLLNGTTFAAPAAIGSGTPAAGNFTTLGASGLFQPALGITATGAAISLNDSSNFNTTINTGSSTGTVTIGQNTATPSSIVLKGPVSVQAGTAYTGASWTTVSPVLNVAAATLNDTTASGTIATEGAYSIQSPTFTSTGGASTTITSAAALWIAAPTCSGGLVCTSLYSALFNGGTRTNGNITGTAGSNITGGTVNLNASSNNAVNIGTGTTTTAVTLGGGAAAQLLKFGSPFEAVGGTAFTVSGCGTAGSILGGSWGGSFTVGTGATNCTFTVTISGATGTTAAHGWILNMDDTTAAIHCINSATVSTTTAIATCTGTVATSDLIKFFAVAY